MISFVRIGLAVTALALVVPSAAAAQAAGEMPKEFGLDAAARFGFGDSETTIIALPAQNFRVGFYRTPTVALEPYGALNYYKFGSGDGTTVLTAGTGLLYNFGPDRRSTTYARPFAELNYSSGGSGDSQTQFAVGAGLGIKLPWRNTFATRYEANLGYAFESGNVSGGVTLGLSAGLSFFTF